MKKTSISIAICKLDKEGQRDIPAYESGIPGLVVHKYVNRDGVQIDGEWIVTHVASGKAISPQGAPLTTRKAALGFAQELDGLIDWTRSEEGLKSHLSPELSRVVKEKMCDAYRKYN